MSGLGIGFLNNPAIQRIMAVAPEAEKHIAGTSVQAVRNIGMSFGAAASGMVAASAGLADGAGRATARTSRRSAIVGYAWVVLLALQRIPPASTAWHRTRGPRIVCAKVAR